MYASPCNGSINKASNSNECAQETNIASRSRWFMRNPEDFYESDSENFYSTGYLRDGMVVCCCASGGAPVGYCGNDDEEGKSECESTQIRIGIKQA